MRDKERRKRNFVILDLVSLVVHKCSSNVRNGEIINWKALF